MARRSFYNFSRGDLISLKEGINAAAVYQDNQPFAFGAFSFTAGFDDTGIVISRVSENNLSVLHHYIRVLFNNGKIGVIISDNLKIVQSFEGTFQKS